MMKTRVISAFAAIALFAAVICLEDCHRFDCQSADSSGREEFNGALEKGGYRPVSVVSFASCIPVLYIALYDVFLPAEGSRAAVLFLQARCLFLSCWRRFSAS